MFGLVLIVLSVAGALLLVSGLEVRRRGDVPHCLGCGYNLTGLTSNACPECGTTMSLTAIVYGTPYRRRSLAIIGVCLLAVSSASVPVLVGMIDVYPLLPTRVLIHMTRWSNPDQTAKSWAEIGRRLTAGRLSQAHRDRLFEGGGEPLFAIRSVTSPFDAVPVRFGYRIDEVGVPVAIGIILDELHLNDEPFELDVMAYAVDCPGSGYKSSMWSYLSLSDLPSGEHRLTATISVTFHPATAAATGGMRRLSSPAMISGWPGPYSQQTFPIDHTFTVLETEPEDYIRRVRDDTMAERLPEYNRIIKIVIERRQGRHCRVHSDWWSGDGQTKDPLPYGISADVFLRIDEEEIPARSGLTVAKGATSFGLSVASTEFEYTGEPFETVDFILRTNDEHARKSIDIDTIWDGEAVLKGIEVEWREEGP